MANTDNAVDVAKVNQGLVVGNATRPYPDMQPMGGRVEQATTAGAVRIDE
jgi:hypothetical protein